MEGQNKPAAIIEKIVEGKLEKFYGEICLLEQPYMRDDSVKVGELVTGLSGKTGEKMAVRRFTRFRLGQD
jgi:elongation factor Ts